MYDYLKKIPTFQTRYDQETGQNHYFGMGQLHLEIIVDRMLREFNVQAEVGPSRSFLSGDTFNLRQVRGEGFVRQSGGRGQFGVVELELEPLEAGAGVQFEDRIAGGAVLGSISQQWRRVFAKLLKLAFLLDTPVVDVRIALVDGSTHPVDSSSFAFEMAGSLGVQAALKQAKPLLLEPVHEVEVTTPDTSFGDVLGDISARRGQVTSMDQHGHLRVIIATVPLAETFGYATDLRSLTQGRATYSMEFDHYAAAPRATVDQVSGRAAGAVRR